MCLCVFCGLNIIKQGEMSNIMTSFCQRLAVVLIERLASVNFSLVPCQQ